MAYTLDEMILKSKRLRRRKHVLNILHENNIFTYLDLMANPIPLKGLTHNEIIVLDDMRRKELYIQECRKYSARGFRELLTHYTSKHEASRITNILAAHGIYSPGLIRTWNNEQLKTIYGIGPKSLKVLHKVRTEITNHANSVVHQTINAVQPVLFN